MKRLMRFYDEDLRKIIMEKYDARPSQVKSKYTVETTMQGLCEHTEPVFYIEVEVSDE